jgi:hypothetical protein
MKKIVWASAVLISLWGCSNDNKLFIQNQALEAIQVNFRGSVTIVPSDSTRSFTDIPNGTYVYSTTSTPPPNATSSSIIGDAASGQLTFEKNNTKVLLLYSYTLLAGTYTLSATQSSSDPISTSSPTSAQ